jgi:hypothetical protein
MNALNQVDAAQILQRNLLEDKQKNKKQNKRRNQHIGLFGMSTWVAWNEPQVVKKIVFIGVQ